MKRASSWRERLASRMQASSSNPAPPGSRLASFRRLYRWLNLTFLHQGLWPLLILLLNAPLVRPASAAWPWVLAAIGAPTLAAVSAMLYLAQRRSPARAAGDRAAGGGATITTGTHHGLADGGVSSRPNTVTGQPGAHRRPLIRGSLDGRDERPPLLFEVREGSLAPSRESLADMLQTQVRLLLFGVTIVLAAARLVSSPSVPTAGFLLFGVADVVAFQLIHFGVVAGSFAEEDQGQAAAVLLFGLSWGLRELFLAGVGVSSADLGLAFVGGLALGLGVGLVSRLLRAWPGGFWAAAAGHWLLVYLVLGFAG